MVGPSARTVLDTLQIQYPNGGYSHTPRRRDGGKVITPVAGIIAYMHVASLRASVAAIHAKWRYENSAPKGLLILRIIVPA